MTGTYSYKIIDDMDIGPEEKTELRLLIDMLNYWKSRGIALEWALRKNSTLCNSCFFGDYGDYRTDVIVNLCKNCRAGGVFEHWQFDQERFEGVQNNIY